MQVVFLVLNKVEIFEELLVKLAENGVSGGTIIESTGMARALGDAEDLNILGSLRQLLDPHRVESKTMFFIVEKEQTALLRKVIDEVTGGINRPDTGILFGFTLDFVDGLGGK